MLRRNWLTILSTLGVIGIVAAITVQKLFFTATDVTPPTSETGGGGAEVSTWTHFTWSVVIIGGLFGTIGLLAVANGIYQLIISPDSSEGAKKLGKASVVFGLLIFVVEVSMLALYGPGDTLTRSVNFLKELGTSIDSIDNWWLPAIIGLAVIYLAFGRKKTAVTTGGAATPASSSTPAKTSSGGSIAAALLVVAAVVGGVFVFSNAEARGWVMSAFTGHRTMTAPAYPLWSDAKRVTGTECIRWWGEDPDGEAFRVAVRGVNDPTWISWEKFLALKKAGAAPYHDPGWFRFQSTNDRPNPVSYKIGERGTCT